MADTVGTVLFGIVFFAIVISFLAALLIRALNAPGDLERAPAKIQGWAEVNGFKIRASECKFSGRAGQRAFAGPFTGSLDGVVFRVVVTKIGEEKRRVAWIKVGEDFKVIWEDEWRPPEPPVM